MQHPQKRTFTVPFEIDRHGVMDRQTATVAMLIILPVCLTSRVEYSVIYLQGATAG